jgi:hypothetical protein
MPLINHTAEKMMVFPLYRVERYSTSLKPKAWYSKDMDMAETSKVVVCLVTNNMSLAVSYFK